MRGGSLQHRRISYSWKRQPRPAMASRSSSWASQTSFPRTRKNRGRTCKFLTLSPEMATGEVAADCMWESCSGLHLHSGCGQPPRWMLLFSLTCTLPALSCFRAAELYPASPWVAYQSFSPLAATSGISDTRPYSSHQNRSGQTSRAATSIPREAFCHFPAPRACFSTSCSIYLQEFVCSLLTPRAYDLFRSFHAPRTSFSFHPAKTSQGSYRTLSRVTLDHV